MLTLIRSDYKRRIQHNILATFKWQQFAAGSILLANVLLSCFPNVVRAETTSSASEVERQVVAVYERATQAIVGVDWTDGKSSGGSRGILVSSDGKVLLPWFPPNVTLTIRLPNGQTAKGSPLGRSREFDLGLAIIDGPGSWPHVELAEGVPVKAGQQVVTLAYPMAERPGIVSGPLLGFTNVDRTNGTWFLTIDSLPNWKARCFAFDLSGRLIGGMGMNYAELGTAHIQPMLIRSLWDDLVSGKDLDQLRLGGLDDARRIDRAAAKSTISKEVSERVTAASVQIRQQSGKKGWSGTIITKEGLVATCAHHYVMPGTKVVVSLPDGRDLDAEVLGVSFPCDVGLVRITEPGPFSFVEMGESTQMLAGDIGLAAGYGPVNAEARQPRVQIVSVSEPTEESSFLELLSSFKMVAGDSGGGLFDAKGRLVGINCGLFPVVTHRRVELFRKHWDELHATFDLRSTSDLAAMQSEVQQVAAKSRNSVVEVLDGDTPSALGTIVSIDGKIITKASLLSNRPRCRLSDGRVLPARVLKLARKYDLALLQVEADGLRTAVFQLDVKLPAGTLVAAMTGNEPFAVGCIAHPPLSIPPERGRLLAKLRDTERGLEVTELESMRVAGAIPQLLQKGDIILTIDGHPTPNHESYVRLFATENNNPIALAGDQVRLAVSRAEEQIELVQALGPPDWSRMVEQSPRCSGFSEVNCITTTMNEPRHCGGPVIDCHGNLIGVVIAWRNSGWAIVLPAKAINEAAMD